MRLIWLLKNDLAREVESWVGEGLVSKSQGEQICARYGIDLHDQSRHSYGYYLLIGLGYLFVGLAVITLLSANWEQIPRALRMGGLILLTLAVNGFGLVRFRQGRDKAAVIAFFLGSILYGASIMLIAQIYHLGEHFPDGIYWWALGTLPVALLLESRMVMLLAGTLATIWFFVEVELGYFPLSFPVFLLGLGWLVLFRKPSNILFLALLAGILLWLEYALGWLPTNGVFYEFGSEHLTLAVGFLVVAFGLANWLEARGERYLNEYGEVLHFWSIRMGLLLLLVLSFGEIWREYIGHAQDTITLNLIIVLICTALALTFQHLSASNRKSALAAAGIYLLLFLPALMLAQRSDTLALQIVDNLLLLSIAIWLIQSGISKGLSHYFYLGVGTVLITGLVRYVDLVGDYIGATVLFLVFALLLLAAARYWRIKHEKQGKQV